MSFTSETSAQARNKKDQKKKDKIKYNEKKALKAQNGHLLAMYHQLKIKFIENVSCTIDPRIWEKTMKYSQEKFSILYAHISNIRATKRSNGNRYDDEKLRQFFILISFFGRSLNY